MGALPHHVYYFFSSCTVAHVHHTFSDRLISSGCQWSPGKVGGWVGQGRNGAGEDRTSQAGARHEQGTAGHRRALQDGGGQAGEADGAGQPGQACKAQGKTGQGVMCASVCVCVLALLTVLAGTAPSLPPWRLSPLLWVNVLSSAPSFGAAFSLPALRGGAVSPFFKVKVNLRNVTEKKIKIESHQIKVWQSFVIALSPCWWCCFAILLLSGGAVSPLPSLGTCCVLPPFGWHCSFPSSLEAAFSSLFWVVVLSPPPPFGWCCFSSLLCVVVSFLFF